MDHKQAIQDALGVYLKQPQPAYPHPLPSDLALWHCYTVDGGHSILGLVEEHATTDDPQAYLVPIPVKSVLRGYRMERGYVVATAQEVRYDRTLGLLTPRDDDEY